MSEMDDKLNSILSNPQMMQQIMNLAQSLNASGNNQSESPPVSFPAAPPGLNPSVLNRFSSIMQHGTIDKDQQSLLKALSPYLSRNKLQKLERAMHAAKMAGLASDLIGTRSGKPFPGR